MNTKTLAVATALALGIAGSAWAGGNTSAHSGNPQHPTSNKQAFDNDTKVSGRSTGAAPTEDMNRDARAYRAPDATVTTGSSSTPDSNARFDNENRVVGQQPAGSLPSRSPDAEGRGAMSSGTSATRDSAAFDNDTKSVGRVVPGTPGESSRR